MSNPWRRYYETLPEPLRSVMLRELDYDPAKDPLRKDVVRIPLAEERAVEFPRKH